MKLSAVGLFQKRVRILLLNMRTEQKKRFILLMKIIAAMQCLKKEAHPADSERFMTVLFRELLLTETELLPICLIKTVFVFSAKAGLKSSLMNLIFKAVLI